MSVTSLVAHSGDVRLSGSLWLPDHAPRALLLMFPGSGPSDRDNDVLFPPIRGALLDSGVAVCSFDKRGVGESTGSWLTADIDAQATDLVAESAVARAAVGEVPTGLFGHSQGGWVVLQAAASASPDFVITNSGPSVSPHEQEEYSTRQTLGRRGWDADAIVTALQTFSTTMTLTTQPYDAGWPQALRLPLIAELIEAGVFIPTDAQQWSLCGAIIDHDPRPALRSLDVPILALLGGADAVVPARRCAEVYRSTVRPDLLDVRVLPGGNHRLHSGDEFVDGYLDAVTGFVSAQARGQR